LLTKTDVLAYWYKQKKYTMSSLNESPNSFDHKNSFIVNSAQKRLVVLCSHPHTAAEISGFNNRPSISFYTLSMSKFYPEFTFDIEKPWLLKLDTAGVKWEISYDFENQEELEEVVLTFNKGCALDHMFQRIDKNRLLYFNNVDSCQARIYQSKFYEARQIIDNNIQDDEFMKYPYVTGYAKLENISLQEAANLIINKNMILESGLSESELLRIKTKKAILNCSSLPEVQDVYNKFTTELTKYGEL
jgi:hypothetical protein